MAHDIVIYSLISAGFVGFMMRSLWVLPYIIVFVASTYLLEQNPNLAYKSFETIIAILVLAHLLWVNLITYFIYFYDKLAAKRGMIRVPERVLHIYAFIGGSPAALYASKKLRHKSIKKSFRNKLMVILFFQINMLIALLLYVFIIK